MIIELKKFGTTLNSRDNGLEAFNAFKSSLNNVINDELVEINFAGVNIFTPSWGDEFLVPLLKLFNNKLILTNTKNFSVKATLKLLEKVHNIKFIVK